jgi:hypothetical protein
LKELKIGDSYDRAISILGPPDEERPLVGKKRAAVTGTSITYFPRKTDPDASDEERDDWVELIFGVDKKLRYIGTRHEDPFLTPDGKEKNGTHEDKK